MAPELPPARRIGVLIGEPDGPGDEAEGERKRRGARICAAVPGRRRTSELAEGAVREREEPLFTEAARRAVSRSNWWTWGSRRTNGQIAA